MRKYRVAIRIGTSNEEVWKGDHDNFQREYEVHPLIPEVVQFKDWRELNSHGLSGESIVVRGSGVSEDGRENAVLRDARVDLPEMDYRIQPNFTRIVLREGRKRGIILVEFRRGAGSESPLPLTDSFNVPLGMSKKMVERGIRFHLGQSDGDVYLKRNPFGPNTTLSGVRLEEPIDLRVENHRGLYYRWVNPEINSRNPERYRHSFASIVSIGEGNRTPQRPVISKSKSILKNSSGEMNLPGRKQLRWSVVHSESKQCPFHTHREIPLDFLLKNGDKFSEEYGRSDD